MSKRCIIIGSGLTGLTLAKQLKPSPWCVQVLDKGFGPGGRLASRPLTHPAGTAGQCDYGAQFFRATHPQFQRWVQTMEEQQAVAVWGSAFLDSQGQQRSFSTPCYRGVPHQRWLALALAQDLTLYQQTRVDQIHWQSESWQIQASSGASFQADCLAITPPLPQTLDLLRTSSIPIAPEVQTQLAAVTYDACLTVMALLDQPSLIPPPGGLFVRDSPLQWIACNQQKGISVSTPALTIHATPEFSQDHWDSAPETVVSQLIQAAQPWIAGSVLATRYHRWKYSHPKTVVGQRAIALPCPGPLILAGDAFSLTPDPDPSLQLEQAYLSGLAAADLVRQFD
ncbi:NAD(P)/FAD-dependent oxidoreductase [Lyngbya confervoides]|uniref:NAD(P)-binding protein n=1 Tax=Lyngbya confervoides BDU141951 TaxID=1574623 RepID=A0ABD4T4D7_9CYAN|nr:NAD(P)-binding protein [Lyngbya confervoides]MCM1983344.1 NAD(P)-binding protein [Lyngbya confervoides BDU141951]